MMRLPSDRIKKSLLRGLNPWEQYIALRLAQENSVIKLPLSELPFAAILDQESMVWFWDQFVQETPVAARDYLQRGIEQYERDLKTLSRPDVQSPTWEIGTRLERFAFPARVQIDDFLAHLRLRAAAFQRAATGLEYNEDVASLDELRGQLHFAVLEPSEYSFLAGIAKETETVLAIDDSFRRKPADKISRHLSYHTNTQIH